MPIIGEVHGRRVVTFEWDDAAAESVRAVARAEPAAVRVPCCGHTATIRRSVLGLWHFVHRETTGCDYVGDPLEVMLLKWRAWEQARALGLHVELEVRGDGWFCDVVCASPRWTRRVGLQLFRSGRRLTRCADEQGALWKAGIRGAWFVRSLPKHHVPAKELPMFAVDPAWDPRTLGEPRVTVGHATPAFGDVLAALLDGKVQFLPLRHVRDVLHVAVALVPMLCPHCGEDSILAPLPAWRPVAGAAPHRSMVERAIATVLARPGLRGPRMARRDAPLGAGEAGWISPCCHRRFFRRHVTGGLAYELENPQAAGVQPFVAGFEVRGAPMLERAPHWCFPDEAGAYCPQTMPPDEPEGLALAEAPVAEEVVFAALLGAPAAEVGWQS